MRSLHAFLLALLCVAVFVALRAPRVEAAPIGVAIEASSALAATGPALPDSGTVACTAAAAVAIPVTCGMVHVEINNTSSTRVVVGDSTIPDPGASGNVNGATVCATGGGCSHTNVWSGPARRLWCRGDTDTTVGYVAFCVSSP